MGSVKELLGQLDKDSYVSLLSKLIGESKYVQNNPPDLIPEEDRVAKHVLDVLLPYSTTNGEGTSIVNHVSYVEGRGNIIIEHPGTVSGKILSFVGCHLDVVTADPDEWINYKAVEQLIVHRYWVDSADKQPCIGTGSMLAWRLRTTGKLFHSGMPDKAINPLELSMEALKVIQLQFYKDYPHHSKEQVYKFSIPSTMKPTQWICGGINQIPYECTISGDARVTPFYDIMDVKKMLEAYVDDINANTEKLDT